MASETEHCGQKHIRCADDFCRGLIPTVCANMYTATDLCPVSSSRLHRRQYKFSKVPFLADSCSQKKILWPYRAGRKYAGRFPQAWIESAPKLLRWRELRRCVETRPSNLPKHVVQVCRTVSTNVTMKPCQRISPQR